MSDKDKLYEYLDTLDFIEMVNEYITMFENLTSTQERCGPTSNVSTHKPFYQAGFAERAAYSTVAQRKCLLHAAVVVERCRLS